MTTAQAAEHEGSSSPSARSRSTKFMPERLQQIINLVERDKSRAEIADILEVTVGSLQVTCSRLGISLKRPQIDNRTYLLRKRTPLREMSHRLCDDKVLLESTEEQSQGNSQSEPANSAAVAKLEQRRATMPNAATNIAIRMQYRGMQHTHELPLTTQTIGLLALEATLREVSIGELIAEIITAVADEDLFQRVLSDIDSGS
jgi:hypothetical protein